MIKIPEIPCWGEKWVARFKNPDGTENMGMANHHGALPPLIAAILNEGGRDIVITDESCRPNIIDVTGEKNEQPSEVHTRAIGYSPTEEYK